MKKFKPIQYLTLIVGVSLLSAVAFISFANTEESGASINQSSKSITHILANLKKGVGVLPPRLPGIGHNYITNKEAVIPPQCYTRTEGKYNPCYVCHQNHIPERENYQNDGHLQLAYSFSDEGQTNRWKNLFEDRTEKVKNISDKVIIDYINQDNFTELAGRLEEVNFKGYVPKLNDLSKGKEAFDDEGFAKDESQWVTFNYKPVPSTFWPTNGVTDDVSIRLPKLFRENEKGEYSKQVYKANLAILEAAIKGYQTLKTLPLDEKKIGVDLNRDKKLSLIESIVLPKKYVGAAKEETVHTYIYPKGTEFLHTVRYVGVDDDGNIYNAPRMKEVRYMRKSNWLRKSDLASYYDEEYQEKLEGTLPHYPDRGQSGLYNKSGWLVQGFIEDKDGRLRFNTYEETMFCMGCHNAVGSTIDKTFSFARKIDGAAGWGYINLRGMPDAPNQGEYDGEIFTYLKRVGGGTEYRNNDEMQHRWYHEDGSLNEEAILAANDVYELITPSRERALALNKAYKIIVEEQDYIFGRDATLVPPENVYDVVSEDAPTLKKDNFFSWDLRLDWETAYSKKKQAKL